MKRLVFALALLAAPVAADQIRILVDIDPAVCSFAAAKSVEGQYVLDDKGQPVLDAAGQPTPKPAPPCPDYLKGLIEKAAEGWARAKDEDTVAKAMADPAKRAEILRAIKGNASAK
jgi:hypothetical protein